MPRIGKGLFRGLIKKPQGGVHSPPAVILVIRCENQRDGFDDARCLAFACFHMDKPLLFRFAWIFCVTFWIIRVQIEIHGFVLLLRAFVSALQFLKAAQCAQCVHYVLADVSLARSVVHRLLPGLS